MHASGPTLNYPKIPLYQTLEQAVRRWPDNVAIIDKGVRLTYAQLDEQVDRFATALAALGVEAGQQVCLLLPNSIEFVVGFFGALKAGAVPSAMNPAYKEREIAYQYQESEAVMLITREDFYPTVAAVDAKANIRAIVSAKKPIEGTHHFQTLIDTHEATPPRPAVNPKEDLASMPFTSGTTGYPKGVMLTHHNLSSNWLQFARAGRVGQDDVILLFLPLYHIYGAMIMGGGLMQGATLLLQERFDPQGTLALIQEQRPTQLYVVPPVLTGRALSSPCRGLRRYPKKWPCAFRN